MENKLRETPLVSVVIPTYNREHLLPQAIQSVLEQTYQNLEIIVVDDGSTDNTREIMKSFVNSDPRIKYFRHETNKGGGAARNSGIINSQGSYIAFLDSDCQWLPNKLEKQLEIFEKSDSRLGAVGGGTINISGDKIRIGRRKGDFGYIYRKLLKDVGFGNSINWPGGTPTIIIKRECFEKSGLFDELLQSCQEHDMYLRIAKNYYFDVLREPVVKTLSNEAGISSNSEAKFQGRLLMLEKYSSEWPLISKVRSRFCTVVAMGHMSRGKRWEARRYLLIALLAYPFNWKNMARLVAAFIPPQILVHIVRKENTWLFGNNDNNPDD